MACSSFCFSVEHHLGVMSDAGKLPPAIFPLAASDVELSQSLQLEVALWHSVHHDVSMNNCLERRSLIKAQHDHSADRSCPSTVKAPIMPPRALVERRNHLQSTCIPRQHQYEAMEADWAAHCRHSFEDIPGHDEDTVDKEIEYRYLTLTPKYPRLQSRRRVLSLPYHLAPICISTTTPSHGHDNASMYSPAYVVLSIAPQPTRLALMQVLKRN